MKATRMIGFSLCLAALLLAAMPLVCNAEVEAEWTVLFYICGTDLESRFSYATENLRDISVCDGPKLMNEESQEILGEHFDLSVPYDFLMRKNVNVLIETGGCRQWHAQALGMDISTENLQRWRYRYNSDRTRPGRFTLEETLPGASMAKPETLSGFIQWAAEYYPAKKYALVLWDHGGGSKTGLFIDELYGNDVMRLDELGEAFKAGGVHFEAVLFDACMMANLETAFAINEYARWMVASEELVAGKGTAIDAWLQNLILMPGCDGEKLGRWICDMTQIKYANEDNESARQLMTWSVIDLSKIKRVAYYQDLLFAGIRLAYERSPELLTRVALKTFHTEHYGSGAENMWDLAGVFYSNADNTLLNSKTCWEMIEALMDAVTYNVRGSGRAAARGLSFCYATDFSPRELDEYARNCPSANYLSLLDAISPWTAPDWVYDKVTRLPEMDTIDAYKVKVNHVVLEDGMPGFYLDEGSNINVGTVRFSMYRRNPVTGQTVSLGTAPAWLDTGKDSRGIYRVPGVGEWHALDGDICEVEAVTIPLEEDYNTLYNIPISMDEEIWNLRCGFTTSDFSHTVYGLWEGFDSDSTMFNRNVRELSHVNGREYRLLYKIDGKTGYERSAPKTMYRRLTVENAPLPAGTYYLQYIIYDVFMRPMKLKRVELRWDGKRMTIPNADWEGKEILSVADYYATKQ